MFNATYVIPYSPLTHILARVRVADLARCLRVRVIVGHPRLISMTHRSLVTEWWYDGVIAIFYANDTRYHHRRQIDQAFE